MTPTPEPVTEDGLLPCPFCGGPATGTPYFDDDRSPGCYITCTECDVSPDGCYRKADEWAQAVKCWNTRASLNTEPARSGELREEAVALFRAFCRGLEAGHPNRWSSDDSEHAITEFRDALPKTNNEVRG